MAGTPRSPTSPPDRRLRRDAERNRLRILDAAREVFATRGLDASLDDIAHHAGVGVGTVYRRFPDKRVLIDVLFEEQLADLAAAYRDGLADPDPWSGLTSALTRSMELQAADRGLTQLVITDAQGGDAIIRARQALEPLARQLLTRAQDAGVARRDAAASDMPFLQIMLGSLLDATRSTDAQIWRRFLTIILDGLRADPSNMPLPSPPLADEQVERAMRGWKARR